MWLSQCNQLARLPGVRSGATKVKVWAFTSLGGILGGEPSFESRSETSDYARGSPPRRGDTASRGRMRI